MVWSDKDFDEKFTDVKKAINRANDSASAVPTSTDGTATTTTPDYNDANNALSKLSEAFSEEMGKYIGKDALLSKEEEEKAKNFRDEYEKRIGALLGDDVDASVRNALDSNIKEEKDKIAKEYFDKKIKKDFTAKLSIAENSDEKELATNFAKLYHATDKKTITKEDVISKFNEKNTDENKKIDSFNEFKKEVMNLSETEKQKRDAEDLFYKLDKNAHIKVEKSNETKEKEYNKSKPWLYHDSLSKEQESNAKKEYLEDKSVIESLSKTKIAALDNLDKRIERAKAYEKQANEAIKEKFEKIEPIYTQKNFNQAYKDTKKDKDKAERKMKMAARKVEDRLNKLIGKGGLTKEDVENYINDKNAVEKQKKFQDIQEKLRNSGGNIKRSVDYLVTDHEKLVNFEKTFEEKNKKLKQYEYIKKDLPQLYNDYKKATKDLAKAYGDKATKVDKYIAKYEKEAKVIIDKENKKISELTSGSMIGRNLGVGKVSLESLEDKKENAKTKREKLEERAASWDITGISEWRARRLAEREEKLDTRIDIRKEEIKLRKERIDTVTKGKTALEEIKVKNKNAITAGQDEHLKKRLLQDPSIPKELREQLAGKEEKISAKASNFASRMKKRFSSSLPGAKYNTNAKMNKTKDTSHTI